MLKTQPTIAQIDEVTAFLPMLYGEDAEPFVAESKWEASDVIVLSGSEYSKAVLDFLSVVSSEPWKDPDYLSKGVEVMLEKPEAIANASIDEIRTMLTHCVRRVRFSLGYLEHVLSGGQIQQILERLLILRAQIPGQGR